LQGANGVSPKVVISTEARRNGEIF